MVLIRLLISRPIFGDNESSWTFLCEPGMAKEFQQAMLDRRPFLFAFPKNSVIIDTQYVILADFQPQ